MKIPILLFDIDDTLYNTRDGRKLTLKAIWINIPVLQKISFQDFFHGYNQVVKNFYKDHEPSGFNTYARIEMFHNLCKKFNIILSIKEYKNMIDICWNTTHQNLKLFPNVKETLIEIKKRNYTTCAVSAGDYYSKSQKLLTLDIEKYFDYCIPTEFVQRNKSTGDIYRFIVNFFNKDPADFIMIGDVVKQDIKPANEVGTITVQATTRGDQPIGKEGLERPNYIIHDMSELLNIVE